MTLRLSDGPPIIRLGAAVAFGAFAAGATTGPGAVVGTALPFDDPTATAPLTR